MDVTMHDDLVSRLALHATLPPLTINDIADLADYRHLTIDAQSRWAMDRDGIQPFSEPAQRSVTRQRQTVLKAWARANLPRRSVSDVICIEEQILLSAANRSWPGYLLGTRLLGFDASANTSHRLRRLADTNITPEQLARVYTGVDQAKLTTKFDVRAAYTRIAHNAVDLLPKFITWRSKDATLASPVHPEALAALAGLCDSFAASNLKPKQIGLPYQLRMIVYCHERYGLQPKTANGQAWLSQLVRWYRFGRRAGRERVYLIPAQMQAILTALTNDSTTRDAISAAGLSSIQSLHRCLKNIDVPIGLIHNSNLLRRWMVANHSQLMQKAKDPYCAVVWEEV